MQKTYTINLSGKIFHIDDNALDKLQSYINTLKAYYSREADGNEIMDDIENRIAELFSEYLKEQYREMITIEEVEKMIATTGAPDDIIDEEVKTEALPKKQVKKLYRDPDNRFLGGVASGMAAYWGLSPLLIRICFIIMAFYYGILFIVYIILWIAIPKAKTVKQKLEMKGEDVNVSNIERSIKEEFQEIKNGKVRKYAERYGKGISDTIQIFGKIISTILGVILFIGSVLFLIAFLTLLFLPQLFPWSDNFVGLAYIFSNVNLIIANIAVLLLGIIPIALITFVSIKLLFLFKSNNKVILLSALILWLIGLNMLVIAGLCEGKNWIQNEIQHGKILRQESYIMSPAIQNQNLNLPYISCKKGS